MRGRASFIRIRAAGEVRASLGTFGGRVIGLLDGRRSLPPPAEGEPGFTYQGLFDLLDEELATVQQGLVEAEDDHLRKKIQVAQLRTTGEDLTATLYDQQVAARRAIAAAFGTDRSFEVAAVSGDTPRELWGLVDQVDQTVKILQEPAAELPEVIVEGGVNLATFADQLHIGLRELRKTGAGLERARKAAGESLIVRNQAIAEFNAVFPPVARTLEGLFRLAGENELAERIRTSARRATRQQGDGEPEEEPAPAGSSEGEGTPEPTEPAPSSAVS